MKIRRKRRVIILSALSVLLLSVGYFLYPIVRYSAHNYQEFQRIPDELSLDIPFSYDGHFSVPCTIDGKEVSLIVDTKATCIMKEEDIAKFHGAYFGRHSLSTKNVRGQRERILFYSIPDFRIDTFSMKPLFGSVGKGNYMYHLVGSGVLGNNILRLCNWFFSIDEGRVRVFSTFNEKRLEQGSRGFHKIQNGLEDDGIISRIGSLKEELTFTLDLGNNVEVLVNNNVASRLKSLYPYKTFLTLRRDNSIDSLFVFDGVPVVWDGITIPNCQIANNPKFASNKNFFGAQLMHRFNFILNYGADQGDNLYIQPKKDFDQQHVLPIISVFGLSIEERAHGVIVSRLEADGIAEKAGLTLGDVVLELDGHAPKALLTSQDFIRYTADKKEIRLRIKGKGEMQLAL
ncbi:hypothetical protein T229_06280 [Tannerella sp. oral taxon BU063 isolate Cell 5]|uniref:PDZ domain-containing protein n=1 Tax=Tannerella sp. oral taxon BU063 isolate Cell 5 TaxID=1410950 RepID=W2CCT5_9BACT|nr:hypothetical protein T229_06280 [Tannerella sp. oral taxon BU063 isolate Cell 5]